MRWAETADRVAREIAAGRRAEGERLPGVRMLARQAGCSAGTAARAYAALRDAGLIAGAPRSSFVVAPGAAARAASWDPSAGPAGSHGTVPGAVLLAGSDDPALDLVLRESAGSASVAPGARGSVPGLEQLARGTADAAAVHLLDVASGRWNEGFARSALAGQPVVLMHLWKREEGLQADSHLAVAAAVAAGAADAGLAVRSVADSLDLDWIPVATEWFELAMAAGSRHAVDPLLDVLGSASVQERLAALPGYDLA